MRNLIVGDIHGCLKKLIKALTNANYSCKYDNLFSVGDFCDRGYENVSVIRFLMSLPHFYPVLGNHDLWLRDYLLFGNPDFSWMNYNGGDKTIKDFQEACSSDDERKTILNWISSIPAVRITDKYCVIHGGPWGYTQKQLSNLASVNPWNCLEIQKEQVDRLLWDRSYLSSAISHNNWNDGFEVIPPIKSNKLFFVGHTPLIRPFYSPLYRLVAVDTGAFFEDQPLIVMDMDSLEYWSDISSESHNVHTESVFI